MHTCISSLLFFRENYSTVLFSFCVQDLKVKANAGVQEKLVSTSGYSSID
jgi:hypothetical protein